MPSKLCVVVLMGCVLCFVTARAADITGEGHRFIAGQDGKQIAIVNPKGEIEWSYNVGAIHDAQLLPNGNVLFQTNYENIVEVSPDKEDRLELQRRQDEWQCAHR